MQISRLWIELVPSVCYKSIFDLIKQMRQNARPSHYEQRKIRGGSETQPSPSHTSLPLTHRLKLVFHWFLKKVLHTYYTRREICTIDCYHLVL